MLGKGEFSEIASSAGDDVVEGGLVVGGSVFEESVDADVTCEAAGGSAAVLGV